MVRPIICNYALDPDTVQLNAAVYARDRLVRAHVRMVTWITVTITILITMPYRVHTGELWPGRNDVEVYHGISVCSGSQSLANTVSCSLRKGYCHDITPHENCAA